MSGNEFGSAKEFWGIVETLANTEMSAVDIKEGAQRLAKEKQRLLLEQKASIGKRIKKMEAELKYLRNLLEVLSDL